MAKKLLILMAIFLIIAIGYCAFRNYVKIPSEGRITTINLKAYQDSQCLIPLTSINWGILSPSSNRSYTAYLLNYGNVNTTLSMKTQNWNPENATNYLTLTWDAEGKILEPNKPLEVMFTLMVSSDIEGITDFSFEILITALEY